MLFPGHDTQEESYREEEVCERLDKTVFFQISLVESELYWGKAIHFIMSDLRLDLASTDSLKRMLT